jgi:type I restriction enzyme S subunit
LKWIKIKLRDVAPAASLRNVNIPSESKIWQLNLDKIESHTGCILEKVLMPLSQAGSSTHWFDERHVLYSKLRPYLNKVVLPDSLGLATTELVPLLPDPQKLDRKFLAYYLRSPNFVEWVDGQTDGAKMPRVSMKIFWEHEISLPSLEDQRQITAILEKADNLLKQSQLVEKDLNVLVQSKFLEMFILGKNYPNIALQEVCELITDGTHYTPEYAASGVIFLSARNVTSRSINWNKIKFIPESLHIELQKRVSPKFNDILLAKNGTTGMAAIVDRDCVFDIYVSLALLRASEKILPTYLLGALNSPICERQFSASLKGIGVQNLHLKEIRQTKIPMPPLELQSKFEQSIKLINKQRINAAVCREEQEKLFNSLLQKSFNGELEIKSSRAAIRENLDV